MYSAEFLSLKEQCSLCKNCPCHTERLNTVFGKGAENASVLFVGDIPRGKDDLAGTPFSGKEGELLEKFLILAGLSTRENVFITNILKCRPENENDINDAHLDLCMEHLRNQVRIIKPKIILCFGERTAKKMIDPSFSLRQSHGSFIKKGKLFFLATYHPIEALRSEAKRLDFLADMQALREAAQNAGII